MNTNEAIDHYAPILSRLRGLRWFQSGKGAALCPQHDDSHASLSVSIGRDGQLLMKCMAKHGCTFKGVCDAIGVKQQDCFPPKDDAPPAEQVVEAVYPYTDEFGEVLYEAVRLKPKGFYQRRPAPGRPGQYVHNITGVELVPYNLPEIASFGSLPGTVWVVEGEKKVEALRGLGLVGTCNAGGAEKWPAEWGPKYFTNKAVNILPDHDEAGWKHAYRLAKLLAPYAGPIRIVELPALGLKDDICDWLPRLNFKPGEGDDREELARSQADFNRAALLAVTASTPIFDAESADPALKLRMLRMLIARALAQSA